ncbi:zinc metalloproteinase nas-14 [Lingula anatina]|uniref:Metalloendopeptidase n=1 Tax=Lingula anatina TaxID=7574 RepID=A0A1S3IPX4_LINAN|nr:zinc metalloproteinase nas-14 [Lingula anatina]|eukprot:XP_013400113.1 zinc metalloproteinase nas-14 [Lingula anatina]
MGIGYAWVVLLLGLNLLLVPGTKLHSDSVTKYAPRKSLEYASKGPQTTPRLFEGDIVGFNPFHRNALADSTKLWRGGFIPVKLDQTLSSRELISIQNAMLTISRQTCVRFMLRTNHPDFVFIRKSKSKCYSFFGRKGGKQDLNLTSGCLRYEHLIIHELMHALGFVHEHSRPDRDHYIDIHPENIRQGNLKDFEKLPVFILYDLGAPYDVNSILHYEKDAFSKNGKPTITPKDPSVTLGNTRMSTWDVVKINRLYRCSGDQYDIAGPKMPPPPHDQHQTPAHHVPPVGSLLHGVL